MIIKKQELINFTKKWFYENFCDDTFEEMEQAEVILTSEAFSLRILPILVDAVVEVETYNDINQFKDVLFEIVRNWVTTEFDLDAMIKAEIIADAEMYANGVAADYYAELGQLLLAMNIDDIEL